MKYGCNVNLDSSISGTKRLSDHLYGMTSIDDFEGSRTSQSRKTMTSRSCTKSTRVRWRFGLSEYSPRQKMVLTLIPRLSALQTGSIRFESFFEEKKVSVCRIVARGVECPGFWTSGRRGRADTRGHVKEL